MKNKKISTQLITVTGVLSALIIIVSFLPLKTLGLEITFSMVPVAIGAILYGPAAGGILGGVFGIVSFLQCFGYSPFGATLLGISPVKTFLVCVPTRILAGLITGLVFNLLKDKKNLSYLIASITAPVLNTLFFMSALILAFYNTKFIQGFVSALNATNPFMFVILFVGFNGLVEIISGFVICFPVSKALSRAFKQ